MRDCSNGEVRDRLPELMHNRLSGETLLVVRAHVAECADCRAELVLLEQLRAVSVAPPLDSARIVARLPKYRAVPAWRRAMNSAQLRAAAAVVLLVGGYAVITRGGGVPETTTPAVVAEPAVTNELAIGDSFQDLTDSDLAAMVEEIGNLEAVTPEPVEEPLLPLGDAPSGGA
jgi:hypothetical protein